MLVHSIILVSPDCRETHVRDGEAERSAQKRYADGNFYLWVASVQHNMAVLAALCIVSVATTLHLRGRLHRNHTTEMTVTSNGHVYSISSVIEQLQLNS